MERKKFEEEIEFIAKYYKSDLFNTEKTLNKIRPVIRTIRSWQRIAAVSFGVITLSMAVAFLIRNLYYSEAPEKIETTVSPNVPLESVSQVIDFDDAPLSVVISQIETVYNVEVMNVPEDETTYRLSLHYEGNVIDLIDTINDILGTNLEIKE